jgi:hypothetical protein
MARITSFVRSDFLVEARDEFRKKSCEVRAISHSCIRLAVVEPHANGFRAITGGVGSQTPSEPHAIEQASCAALGAAAWEPDRRFPDAKIFCRLDIAMSTTLQAAVPFECPQTEAGKNSRGEPAGR